MTNLLDIITPTNLEEERLKFLSSSSYNPTFHYFWQDESLTPNFGIMKKYPLWDAISRQDHKDIVKAASDLFEVIIDEQVVGHAEVSSSVKGRVSLGSAKEYAELLSNALKEFGLDDVRVEITSNPGFNSRPNHSEKKVIVSEHIHFEYFSMEGGVNHELVHVLRYHNGKFNGIERSQRFLPTEEGLAAWCQDNTNDDNGLAQHAIEYFASSVGLKGSLRDVYSVMRDFGMGEELAWKRASRHKFGFVDTAKPGDILKPAMYYANEVKVAQLTRDEKLRLFVGKINQDELSDHPKYKGLWSEEKLATWFKL